MGIIKKAAFVTIAAASVVAYKSCEATEADRTTPGGGKDTTITVPQEDIGISAADPTVSPTTLPREVVEVVVTVSADGKQCGMQGVNGEKILSFREGSRIMASTGTPGASFVLVKPDNTLDSNSDVKVLSEGPTPIDLPSKELFPVAQCFTPSGTLSVAEGFYDDDKDITSVPITNEAGVVADNLQVEAFHGGDLTLNIEAAGLQFP